MLLLYRARKEVDYSHSDKDFEDDDGHYLHLLCLICKSDTLMFNAYNLLQNKIFANLKYLWPIFAIIFLQYRCLVQSCTGYQHVVSSSVITGLTAFCHVKR